jgi:NAD+ kinase
MSVAQPFPTIALVGRHASPGIAEPLNRLAAFLVGRGHRVLIGAETPELMPIPGYPSVPMTELGREAKLAIVIGGDGTMLSIARQLAPFDVPLIGINQGRLGFLTDIAVADMENVLAAMLGGAYMEETRSLLDATLVRVGGSGERALALNDVFVNRGAIGGMIDCAVTIDGRFVYAMRADGLIVATPTGSTAYNLAAGGPIVQPSVDALILTPIAPHTLTNRPIIIPASSSVRVQPHMDSRDEVFVTFDGQAGFQLEDGDEISICRAERSLRLIHPSTRSYFEVLRQKLKWGER